MPEGFASPAFDRERWAEALVRVSSGPPFATWRAYMSRIYEDLARYGTGTVLKTDLFEEALGPQNPMARLPRGSFGMDGCLDIVRAARRQVHTEGRPCRLFVGDLRQVPLRSGSVEHILSGSSLDHFADRRDLDASLAELARILAPGGVLAITLDNPQNPLIWLRNRLSHRIRRRTRLTPFFVGATYGHRRLRGRLEAAGLTILAETAVVHAPRIAALWLTRVIEASPWPGLSRPLASALRASDALARLPTRFLTGHYVALHAAKPGSADPPRP